jgi:L-fucose dehydrogenase
MDLGLKNKIVVVTDCSTVIGKTICNSLANEGAIPFIVGKNDKEILRIVSNIKLRGGTASYAIANPTDPDECQIAVETAFQEFGKINGLVNCFGLHEGTKTGTSDYDEFINENLIKNFAFVQHCLPLLKHSLGAIVNVDFKSSIDSYGKSTGYSSGGVWRDEISKEWASLLFRFGVKFNSLILAKSMAPGFEQSSKKRSNIENKTKEIFNHMTLGSKSTTPGKVANMTLFLLSGKSKHVNGQLIYVDGGSILLDRAIN